MENDEAQGCGERSLQSATLKQEQGQPVNPNHENFSDTSELETGSESPSRKSRMRPISNLALKLSTSGAVPYWSRHSKIITALFIKKQIPNLPPRSAMMYLYQMRGTDLHPHRDRITVTDFTRVSSNSYGASWDNPSYFTVALSPHSYPRCLRNDCIVPLVRHDTRTLAYHWPPFFPVNECGLALKSHLEFVI